EARGRLAETRSGPTLEPAERARARMQYHQRPVAGQCPQELRHALDVPLLFGERYRPQLQLRLDRLRQRRRFLRAQEPGRGRQRLDIIEEPVHLAAVAARETDAVRRAGERAEESALEIPLK